MSKRWGEWHSGMGSILNTWIWNTKYYLYLNTIEKIECILYLNTFNLAIFVFSNYIKYVLPIDLFIRLLYQLVQTCQCHPWELQLYDSSRHGKASFQKSDYNLVTLKCFAVGKNRNLNINIHRAIYIIFSLLMILDCQSNTCYFAVYKTYKMFEMVITLWCAWFQH